MNALAGEDFEGLERFEARKKLQKLDAMGLLVDREAYENKVGYSERGQVPIGHVYRAMVPKIPKVAAQKSRGIWAIRFYRRWKKTYLHWLDGIQDWSVANYGGDTVCRSGIKGLRSGELDFHPEHVRFGRGTHDPKNWEQNPMCSILGLPPTYGRWQIWAGRIEFGATKNWISGTHHYLGDWFRYNFLLGSTDDYGLTRTLERIKLLSVMKKLRCGFI